MKNRFLHILMTAVLFLALPAPVAAGGQVPLIPPAAPQSVQPDPGFGGFGDGSGFVDVKGMTVTASVQDGIRRIVVVGYKFINPNKFIQVQRFLPDGALDASFAFTKVIQGEPHAVAVDDSGRIVVAGEAQNDFFVMRLHDDGSLDTSFALTGFVKTDFDSQEDSAEAVGVQPNGRIVAGGWGYIGNDPDFAAARYLDNGALDSSFSGDGKATTGFGSGYDEARAMLLLPGSQVVLAGAADDCSFVSGCDYDFGLARYQEDGSLDPAFDGDGKLTLGFSNNDMALSLALTPDGSQIVAGGCANCFVYITPDYDSDLALARLSLIGVPDATFDGDGKATYPLTFYDDRVAQVFPRSDGSILLAAGADLASEGGSPFTAFILAEATGAMSTAFGYANDLDGPQPQQAFLQSDGKIVTATTGGLYRYLPNGARDVAGSTAGDFDANNNHALAVLPVNGGYWVVGEAQTRTIFNQQVSLAFYDSYGHRYDTEFNNYGVTLAGGAGDDFVRSAALDRQGRVVAAGFFGGSDANFAVYRFSADHLDTTFHGLGYTFTDFGQGSDYAQAILLQPQADGSEKIVAAGFAFDGVTYDLAMARYNDNGSLDSTFGKQGKVRHDLGSGFVRIRAAVVQADRKLVVAGGHAGDFVVVRFTPDGDLDPTFGASGIVEVTLGGNDEAHALALYPNNLLLVAGYTSGDFGWILLNQSDGSLCKCGSISGVNKADFVGDETPYAVLVQADGKILLAGGNTTTSSFLLARWRKTFPLQNGYELDPTFGAGGQMSVRVENWSSAQSMAFDWLNRLVVAGDASNKVDEDEALLRLTGVAPPPAAVLNNAVFIPLLNR